MFGISEKKKRGIVVPVMALAVCAVAMVGLGYALETSVTSSNNSLQSLMIDLDDRAEDLGKQNGKPDSDKVDGLFSIGISTVKADVSTGTPVIRTVTGGKAYLEVFGNVEDIDIFVLGNDLGSDSSVSFAIYEVSGETRGGENGTATIPATSGATKFTGTYTSSTVYWVEVTSITVGGSTISLNHNVDGTVSISDADASKLYNMDELSLSFTFSSKPKA